MGGSWTEIIVKVKIDAMDRAEAALHMAAPLGLYVEDYSDLETAVGALAGGEHAGCGPAGCAELIDGGLLAKDRGAAFIHVYFQPGADMGKCVGDVRNRLLAAGLVEAAGSGAPVAPRDFAIVSAGEIFEEDWADNWKTYFKPLRVGKSILIRPEWVDLGGEDRRLTDGVKATINIDPGMAFGTGQHATTRLCLELLEKCLNKLRDGVNCGADVLDVGCGSGDLCASLALNNGCYGGDGKLATGVTDAGNSNSIIPVDVLDVGCGSGILSIAAVLLGARSALGVDTDAYAVKNARENAAKNGVQDRAIYKTGNLVDGIRGQYGVIVANIVADVVIRLLDGVKPFLLPGGYVILSGIIDDREADVTAAARANGFTILETPRAEGWTAFLLQI